MLQAHYYAPLSRSVLAARTLSGMIHRLDDPYTRYLSPGDYRLLRDAEDGAYTGIGVTVLRAPGGLLVTSSIPRLPASRAGLQPGDLITTVDGTSLATLSYRRALDLMAGDEGTPVEPRVRPVRRGPRRARDARAAVDRRARRGVADDPPAGRELPVPAPLRLPGVGRPLGAPAGAGGREQARRRPHPRPAREPGRPPVAGGRGLADLRPERGRGQHGGPARAAAVLLRQRHGGGRQAAGRGAHRRVDRERGRGDRGRPSHRRRRHRRRASAASGRAPCRPSSRSLAAVRSS